MKEVINNKIVIATNELSTGGLGTYLVTLSEGLKISGWAVHLLTTNVRGNLFDRMNTFVQCHDMSEFVLSVGKIFKAASLVNSINPDILLINNCSLLHYALPLIKNTVRPVAVLHSDDARFYRTAALFSKSIFRWIAPTQGVADRFALYLQKNQGQRVRLIPHGIDNKLFTVNAKRGQRITKNICFVGYLAENKGADLLPDIFLRVSNSYPDVRFTIVGYGPLEQTLRRRCKEIGVIDKCAWTGAIDNAKVAEILHHSDILLLPTRIEGFGLSIVEAMMSEAVPVVSRLAGITDTIVTNNETGMLVEVDDVEGFSSAIIELLSNPDRLSSMKHAAQKAAQEKFSLQRMIDDYELLFAEEDDRPTLKRYGVPGWAFETLSVMSKKDPDGTYQLHKKLGTVKSVIISFAGKIKGRDASARFTKQKALRIKAWGKEDCSSSVATVVIVDKSRVMAGAERYLCILTENLNKTRFRVVIAADYPLPHHAVYRQSGTEVQHRATGLKWWMGTDRWQRPLRGTDAIKRIIFARKLQHIMTKSDAQILHVNLLSRDSWFDLAAARRMGIQTVGSVQSLLLQRPLDRQCLKLCDAVICVSDCVAREISRFSEVSIIKRIYNPISVAKPIELEERYSAKRELGLNRNDIVISSVAMLDPRKGHDISIFAFAKLSAEFPCSTLLIVGGPYTGDGNMEVERLQKIAVDSGVGSRVIFCGYIAEMRIVYAASDIVLALSNDGEAFGRVPVEAASHGRVAIATALGATPELIRDGITGFLVPLNDPSAVAETCRRVLADKDLAQQIGAAGIKHVAKNFHPDTIAQQTEAVYEQLLKMENNS